MGHITSLSEASRGLHCIWSLPVGQSGKLVGKGPGDLSGDRSCLWMGSGASLHFSVPQLPRLLKGGGFTPLWCDGSFPTRAGSGIHGISLTSPYFFKPCDCMSPEVAIRCLSGRRHPSAVLGPASPGRVLETQILRIHSRFVNQTRGVGPALWVTLIRGTFENHCSKALGCPLPLAPPNPAGGPLNGEGGACKPCTEPLCYRETPGGGVSFL